MVRTDVVQGVLICAALSFVTAQIVARVKATKINGSITMFGCGVPACPAPACGSEPRMLNYFLVR